MLYALGNLHFQFMQKKDDQTFSQLLMWLFAHCSSPSDLCILCRGIWQVNYNVKFEFPRDSILL